MPFGNLFKCPKIEINLKIISNKKVKVSTIEEIICARPVSEENIRNIIIIIIKE